MTEDTQENIDQSLLDAVNALDDSNGDHWNSKGQPNITHLKEVLSRKQITHAEITAVGARTRILPDETDNIKGGATSLNADEGNAHQLAPTPLNNPPAVPSTEDEKVFPPQTAAGGAKPPADFSEQGKQKQEKTPQQPPENKPVKTQEQQTSANNKQQYKVLINLSHDNTPYKIDSIIDAKQFDDALIQDWLAKGYIEAV